MSQDRQHHQLSETTARNEGQPAPGRGAILLAALVIGMLLMGVQLWLLTVALDLYLSGDGSGIWLVALISGLVFLGGLLVIRGLAHRTGRRSGPAGR